MSITLNLKTFLIVCPLVFIAGFVDSIGGGGGLISLPAYLFAGIPIHNATATNKLSSSMGTVISVTRICHKQIIRWKLVLPAIILSLSGSFIGTKLNMITGDVILKRILLIILPVVAILMFKSNFNDEYNNLQLTGLKEKLVVWLSAFIMGIYDGFYGPGTGTFLMMIFIGVVKMRVREAAMTTKLLNISSNVASLLTFLRSGYCVIVVGVVAGLCNMAGAYVGSGLVVKDGKKIVKPIIIVVLIIMFIKVLSEL